MSETEDYVLVFEAPVIVPPEFRLYYDEETGKVLFYTCEKPEGKYIVIDSITFACARQDVRVVNGKLSTVNPSSIVSKLKPSDSTGTRCLREDISIVADEDSTDVQTWKLMTYELR